MDKSGENYADLANINLLLILDGFANMIEICLNTRRSSLPVSLAMKPGI
jgi:hypothetical protein